jgi:hypothetical protein
MYIKTSYPYIQSIRLDQFSRSRCGMEFDGSGIRLHVTPGSAVDLNSQRDKYYVSVSRNRYEYIYIIYIQYIGIHTYTYKRIIPHILALFNIHCFCNGKWLENNS